MLAIPAKFRPLLVAAAVIAVASFSVFLADLFDLGERESGPCCATEFDATPYQQVPAKTLP